ncbi:hypothetical protein QBC45DRAFT_393115 [Copromyces sp. CBS 386.78]|nr:hypothetical protein QBC45DRAFT_393115 [Copromyces sp. CBS 386.78]
MENNNHLSTNEKEAHQHEQAPHTESASKVDVSGPSHGDGYQTANDADADTGGEGETGHWAQGQDDASTDGDMAISKDTVTAPKTEKPVQFLRLL